MPVQVGEWEQTILLPHRSTQLAFFASQLAFFASQLAFFTSQITCSQLPIDL